MIARFFDPLSARAKLVPLFMKSSLNSLPGEAGLIPRLPPPCPLNTPQKAFATFLCFTLWARLLFSRFSNQLSAPLSC